METSMLHRIQALRRMSVAELQREWEAVFGAPTTCTSHQHLWRKIAWEVQARAHGGLSDAARARLEELGQAAFERATSRQRHGHDAEPATPASPEPRVTRIRDPRRVLPGTVLTRVYHGTEIRVVALDEGQFEHDGRVFSSLSAVARTVTGAKWSGNLFFGLRERKRKR